ncbi:MAG: AAA family ATPase, partial [Actinomycetota bacterium]|nr:AAA family ATPase [Actinomycetota bacterium]
MRADAILVGRHGEVAALDAALDALEVSPSGVMFELSGEPGIGKSRLLAELGARADERAHVVLPGRAAELEHDLPFGVFVDALDSYLASLDRDLLGRLGPQVLAELATAFPSLARFGEGHQPALQAERFRTHRAVRALLEELGSTQPTVVLLDDVHWAEPASRELLGHLLAYPPRARVLVAVAFRPAQLPGALGQALATAAREGRARRLDLGPLTTSEANELVGPALGAEARAELYRESGGNPFYLEQLVRATSTDRRAIQVPVGRGDAIVPPAVRAALAAELDSLPPPARRLLEGAAVAGDPFDADLAAPVAGLGEADALEVLDALLALDLVRPTTVPRRFRFRHPILRRAVYETTGGGWRLGAHARAAAALGAVGAPAAVRAHHVEHSAKPGDDAAVALLIEAGYATAPRAPATAAHWYGAALRLLPQSDTRRLELLVARATALGAAGELEDSRAALCQVLELLPPEMGPTRVDVVCFCAGVEGLLGRYQQAEGRLLEALTQVVDDRSAEAASLQVEISVVASLVNDFSRARRWAAKALAIATPLGNRALRMHAMALLAFNDYSMGQTAEALNEVSDVTALLDSLDDGDLASHMGAAWFVVWAELALERYHDVFRHGERILTVCRATGQGHYVVPVMQAQLFALIFAGRLRDALQLGMTGIDAARVWGHDQALSNALLFWTWAAMWSGDVEAGIRAGEQAVEHVRHLDESIMRAAPGCMLGVALVEAGQFRQARVQVLSSGGGPDLPFIGRIARAIIYESLTRAELGLGSLEAAEEWAER